MQRSVQELRQKMTDADAELVVSRKAFREISERMTSLNEEKNRLKNRLEEMAPADLQSRIQQQRERMRSQLKSKDPVKFDSKVQEEDDKQDV